MQASRLLSPSLKGCSRDRIRVCCPMGHSAGWPSFCKVLLQHKNPTIMKTFFSYVSVVLAALYLVGCDSASIPQNSTFEDELFDLTERYLSPDPDNSLLVVGIEDDELFRDATVTGRTESGIPFAQFTGDAISPILLTVLYKTLKEPDCSVDNDAGLLAKKKFASCVDEMLDKCEDGVLLKKEDGKTNAYGQGDCGEDDG